MRAEGQTLVFKALETEVRFHNRSSHQLEESNFVEASLAMALVWKRYVGASTVVNVYVRDVIEDAPLAVASYDPTFDSFEIAINNLGGFFSTLPLYKKLILAMSHEMMHRVQKYKGKEIRGNAKTAQANVGEYASQPWEVEANTEMIHIAKYMYPAAEGSFSIGSQTYVIPKTSWYCEIKN